MTKQEIREMNSRGDRDVLYSREYEKLIPNSDCKKVITLPNNMYTCFIEMPKWIKSYCHETIHLSKVLKKDSIESTVNNIQWFLYSHLKYYYDLRNVYLKSPSCIWKTKSADCKLFTIFASSILLNLGIKHYLRYVEYENWHVYVVIPKDQKKGKLKPDDKFNEDYIIIDGTIESNDNELPFKALLYDCYMSNKDLSNFIRMGMFFGSIMLLGLLLKSISPSEQESHKINIDINK